MRNRYVRIAAPPLIMVSLIAAMGAQCGVSPPDVDARFQTPTRSSTIAITSDDRFVIVANRENDSVSILEVANADGDDVQNKLAEIPVGDEPRFVALSPDDATAYVSNTVSGTVSAISLAGASEFSLIDEITVGSEPRGMAVTPNGTRLIVANHTSGTCSIVDTSNFSVIDTVEVGGNPQAVAITNDGDDDDTDETVFVTRYYARLVDNGPGEGFDGGKEGIVESFKLSDPAGTLAEITLAPLADSGFTADRSLLCQQLNANAVNDTFCPDTGENDATADVIAKDVQGAFPNQLHAILLRANRAFVPNTGAGPEPPVKFNVNVQALVSVFNTDTFAEETDELVNVNAQIKLEDQPAENVANTVLDRLFANDLVAIDANANGDQFLLVSRGGNFVIRAALDANGNLSIDAPDNVVRLQTGNVPSGVVMNSTGTRAYTCNDVGLSVTALNLENSSVIKRDIASSLDPVPGTFEHGVLVGKLAFFSALGTPDNGIFSTPIRDIVPLASRGKMSDNSWSSCASCHPDGLADGVTWIFATGPRQTIPLDAFFAKDNPADQRISNWNAIRSSVTDFNNNSINVQGGTGFAGTPPDPAIFNHGISQGASDALDAQTLWVQTVRPPVLPDPTDDTSLQLGRDLFGDNCASCHGGAKWTKSQIIYANNPAFDADPNGMVPGSPRDPNVTNAAAQIVSYTFNAVVLKFIEGVGTFDAASPIEIRANGVGALGGIGFNVPSLLGVAYHAPYFHDGSAQTLEAVFDAHVLGGGTIASELTASQQADLLLFLRSIDGATKQFESETDEFQQVLAGN